MGIETRVVVVSPDSAVTPDQVKSKILATLSEDASTSTSTSTSTRGSSPGVEVKETCFGILVEGEAERVRELVEEVRKLDENGIFSKPRGFPIADPRVCRATRRGGPRPGFHQLELESELLPAVRRALDNLTTKHLTTEQGTKTKR